MRFSAQLGVVGVKGPPEIETIHQKMRRLVVLSSFQENRRTLTAGARDAFPPIALIVSQRE
jgi:hypothetical protein